MSEKPFWEGKTCKELDGLHVKITWNNGDTMTSTLNIFGNAGQCELSPARHPAATFAPYADIKSIELVDDPEYERIDNIEDVREGDIFVAKDLNRYSVCSVLRKEHGEDNIIQVHVVGVGQFAILRSAFSYALRPKPQLPDKPGLWLDKDDAVWCFDGDFLRPLNDIEDAWSVSRTTQFAPFRPAKVVEA